MKSYTTSAVFGIARDIPVNYVTRDNVDGALVNNLTRDKHVVIYGSSKQGKTCLRKHCLQEEDYITVTCSNRWDLGDLHSSILKMAGYELELQKTKTVSGKQKVSAKFGVSIKAPGIGEIGGELGSVNDDGKSSTVTSSNLELDVYDANDIINALKVIEFVQYIVLEDFHYLPNDVQKDFAIALKAFHESSELCFIIVGVWLEENRLIQFNGDLTGRVIAINADKWSDEDLREVVGNGEKLLNVTFDGAFIKDLISGSFESVAIVQEACHNACIRHDINHTQKTLTKVGNGLDARTLIQEVVNAQSGRYFGFITHFASGFQETRLEMHNWILYPVLIATPQELEEGLRLTSLNKTIKDKHPGDKWNPGNLTQALQSTASLQVKKGTVPIILDYDQTKTNLNVVDRGFLIWLEYQEREELLSQNELPIQ
ncbi:MAG: hypothetical protein JKY27_09220 [Magnetovibrio sp.]|nr:hypothetical protein [Magnetovibrio sp.]